MLFKQLFETHPRIIEDIEAPYTVAMLQEMFYQIDYNGDGTTNWDEFTSFCVQTGESFFVFVQYRLSCPCIRRSVIAESLLNVYFLEIIPLFNHIHNAGLSVNTTKAADSNFSLEQYIIEYGEAHLDRDHVLSAYRCVYKFCLLCC